MRVVNIEAFQQFTAVQLLSDPGHIGGPVVVPNGIKLMIVWTLADGKIARNVLGGIAPAGYSPTTALAEAARAALVAGSGWSTLAGFLAPTISLTRVELQDIRSAHNAAIPSTGAATPGTSAGTALPSEVAAVISIRTAKTGQAGRGRAYIPGWATNALGASDLIAAAAFTALTNWTTNISNAITAAGLSWALILPERNGYTSPSTGTVHAHRDAVMAPVTSSLVRDNHWDSQRRRGLR